MTIVRSAEKASELLDFIHRALTLKGRDGRTVLERMVAEQTTHLRAARYDPPAGRVYQPPSEEEQAAQALDPEALTPPPGYSDPTGEAIARGRSAAAQNDLRAAEKKVNHLGVVAGELLEIIKRYPDAHAPTTEDLQASREVEQENRADTCVWCAKCGYGDVLSAQTITVLSAGVDTMRLCEECITCVRDNDRLPTRAEVDLLRKIEPKRMAV